jgi:Heparinase II/III-like protein
MLEETMRVFNCVFHLLLIVLVASSACAAETPALVDPNRVEAIAAMLNDKPFAFGPPVTDRAAWQDLGKQPALHATIAKAEALMHEPIQPITDDLFLEFSKTGNREDYEKVYFNRTGRLSPLVIAECIEHRGRFIPAIEQLIDAFCDQNTWMLPAHDPKLQNYRGQASDIDLFSSALACDLANASDFLGDSLSQRCRDRINQNVRRRVLDPFREMVTGRHKPNWWITADDNWNAVCLANVLGTALAALPDRADRALFAAAAEEDSLHYLDGFAADGYCVEGLGYWNYGFGNYIRLCELLYRATNGKVDCFSRDKVAAIAGFPAKLMITKGVYPAYSDVHLDAQPWPPLVDFVDRRFGIPDPDPSPGAVLSTSLGGSLGETLMFSCPNSASGDVSVPSIEPAARDWFADAQVLTCRPGPDYRSSLAVSIKGGRNGVNHGHDDLGSFVLVVDKTTLLVDPGTEVYTSRTFSKRRYDSKVINSFGHNVPIVAGQLQISTGAARVKILEKSFSGPLDLVSMDLTSAYAVPELTQLTRMFRFNRQGTGSLEITDECRFSKPADFGITFVTFGEFEQTSPTQLVIRQRDRAMQIDLDAGGAALKITSQPIDEDLPDKQKPLRIAVELVSPAMNASLKSTIQPMAKP